MISVTRQFQDGMRACVGSTTGCTRTGLLWNRPFIIYICLLVPLLFNIFFVVVINVAYARFKADKQVMDALVHLK